MKRNGIALASLVLDLVLVALVLWQGSRLDALWSRISGTFRTT